MTTVILTITTTPAPLPSGAAQGQYQFNLNDTAGSVVLTPELSATFPNVAPGKYTASCVCLDTAGNPLPGTATADFEVAAPAMFAAPATMTVQLQ